MSTQHTPAGITYLINYEKPQFLIDTTDLVIEIRADDARVKATLKIRKNPDCNSLNSSNLDSNNTATKNTSTKNAASKNVSGKLVLVGQQLKLESIALNGQILSKSKYTVDSDSLVIAQVPDQFELTTEVLINPKDNSSLEGLYKSRTMYCTQCEAEGFRRITYYLDRPDVMSVFTTTIIADKTDCPVLLSNGNLVGSGSMDVDQQAGVKQENRHWSKWSDPFRKPAYLFAMVAGDLAVVEDSFTTMSGREILIQVYVEPKDQDKCGHAIQSLKHAMAWDERVYGREYDLDLYMIVAVDDFNMGAMENKGLNIFNTSCVLAHPETTTDDGFKRVEAVVAHEYFHNWSGNRVTCRDWFQLSLKEGFTVYRDSEFSADMGSRTVKRVEDVNLLRTVQFAEDTGPTAHPVQPLSYMEISNFYTVTIYEKGAEIVRMIYRLLGAELFRQGSDLYFSRHDGEAVTIEDFIAAMAEVSGRDFSQFMNWYRQAGTPTLSVQSDYDESTKVYRLHFKQQCPPTKSEQLSGTMKKLPYLIPVELGLVGGQGDLVLSSDGATTRVVEITESEQTIEFDHIDQLPVPSLLRGFSAPVHLNYAYSVNELTTLMSHDSDGFNRWNASQQLTVRLIQSLMQDYRAGKPLALDPCLSGVFSKVLSEPAEDRAMQALVLTLPTEQLIAELSDEVDVEAIHAVRQFLFQALGKNLSALWHRNYEKNRPRGGYVHSAEEVAKRSLKNLSLRYLCYGQAEDSLSLLQAQLEISDNMTDRMSALAMLVNDTREQAIQKTSEILEQFYQQWKHEPLVINQWFQLQATCVLPGGLNRVKTLMQHPAFDFNNPNKVRSVIGAFCHSNPINFHCNQGVGYEFLADQVLELDKKNPQIAARLLTPLTRWRRFPEARQVMMKAQLSRIISANKLSPDSYEIVSKSL